MISLDFVFNKNNIDPFLGNQQPNKKLHPQIISEVDSAKIAETPIFIAPFVFISKFS